MTKDNSQPATKKDLKQTEQAIRKDLDQAVDTLRTETKKTEQILREEIKLSAKETKEEMGEEMRQNTNKILNTFDEYLKEVVDSREERVIVAGKIYEHEARIEELENQVFPVWICKNQIS